MVPQQMDGPARSGKRYGYAMLCWRLQQFGLTDRDIVGKPLAEIQAVVRKRYRRLLFGYHPDSHPRFERRGDQALWGDHRPRRLQRLVQTYRWVMELEEADLWPSLPVESCDSAALPWGWDRARPLPWGMHEDQTWKGYA